ncbi:regulator of sigma E protease [Desulfonispora thiosulfatigenes DSM 11270]|uniref:Zinc metalloprotease n=1 Tax=Desulfonispora thiosulfatigenes DSM 11270 TaxID=656914 RepID=A0A1W1VM57_DESTI|nr:RIP metalloprotease RseP [Desulfonispora thiosulfatigenes]SMB94034.1 regulator of sigma E protease [Desulfonispora thiosulfatigenes DSM 11270]
MQTAIYAILIFSLLIFIHEFGHFFVAKLVGVRVEEFSIGMGPKALAFKKGDTQYSVRLLPIGGYVKMTGETGEDEESDLSPEDPRRFNNKTVLQRAAVIIAGPLMNFLLAILIFTFIFSSIGMPFYSSQVDDVVANSPAAKAGLLKGDKIISVDGKEVNELNEVIQLIHGRSGENINFKIERDGKQHNIVIAPQYDPEQKADLIGIMATDPEWKTYSFSQSIGKSAEQTYQVISLTLSEISKMITGKVGTEGVTGPVGIVKIIGDSAKVGILPILNLTALISISLGLMNLLPIPALDGSRLIFLLIEGLRGKPIDAKKENLVHFVGFALLMMLMIFITYKDIMGLGNIG